MTEERDASLQVKSLEEINDILVETNKGLREVNEKLITALKKHGKRMEILGKALDFAVKALTSFGHSIVVSDIRRMLEEGNK